MMTYLSLSFTKLFSSGSSTSLAKDPYLPTVSPSIVMTGPLVYGTGGIDQVQHRRDWGLRIG